jgi:hypothetical protein
MVESHWPGGDMLQSYQQAAGLIHAEVVSWKGLVYKQLGCGSMFLVLLAARMGGTGVVGVIADC